MAREIVVDACVIVKLFIEEDLSDVALRLFAVLKTDPEVRFYAPDLVYIQCAHRFARDLRNDRTPETVERATKNAQELEPLGVELEPFTFELFYAAWRLIRDYGINDAYDASYAALASLKGAQLITDDRGIIDKLRKVGSTFGPSPSLRHEAGSAIQQTPSPSSYGPVRGDAHCRCWVGSIAPPGSTLQAEVLPDVLRQGVVDLAVAGDGLAVAGLR